MEWNGGRGMWATEEEKKDVYTHRRPLLFFAVFIATIEQTIVVIPTAFPIHISFSLTSFFCHAVPLLI